MSSRGLIMTTTNLCTRKGGRHCLHFQEGDGDCCICEKGLSIATAVDSQPMRTTLEGATSALH